MGKDKTPKRPTLQELMRRLTWWAAHNPRDAARALDTQEKQSRQEAEPRAAQSGATAGATAGALSDETLATLQAVGRATVTPDIQHTLALAVFNLLVLQARALPGPAGGTLYDRWAALNADALADVLRATPDTVKRAVRVLYDLGFIDLRPARDGGRGREVRIAREPDAANGGKEGEAFR